MSFLLLGRVVLGVGESFISRAGRVGRWASLRSGTPARPWPGRQRRVRRFAAGAPIGSAVYTRYRFGTVALATSLLSVAALLCVIPRHGGDPLQAHEGGPHEGHGVGLVPGLAAALSSIGFGTITALGALLFVPRAWVAWLAFTVFALVFILTPPLPWPSRRRLAAVSR